MVEVDKMEKKIIVAMVFLLCAAVVVAVEQPTFVGLQGRVTDSVGVPVNNGNVRATVSTTASCEQNIVYDYTFNNGVRAGLFNVLLGNDTNLNLTYNQDYFLCTYINGEIQKNLGGSNTTKFRGGHGQIPANNLVSGTLPDDLNITGNVAVNGSLQINGTLQVNKTPVVLSSDAVSNIHEMDVKMGSSSLTGNGAETTILTWQPVEGEVWQIDKMVLNAPTDTNLGGATTVVSGIKIIMSNGTFDFPIYTLNVTPYIASNIALLLGNNRGGLNEEGGTLQDGFRDKNTVIIEDNIYISNTNYLKINMSNGDALSQNAYWFVQGTKIKNSGSSSINDMDVKMSSAIIIGAGGGTTANILTWQPASGEVWKINKMVLNAPKDTMTDSGVGIPSNITIFLSNGTFDFPVYAINATMNSNLTFSFGDNLNVGSVLMGSLNQGFNYNQTPVSIKDNIYISNTNYLKINMTNGDDADQSAYWFVQGIRVR